MIITRARERGPLVQEALARQPAAVIGCGLCATVCRTGGREQVESLASDLIAAGVEVAWTTVVDGVCQRLLTARALRELPVPGVVLVMACGSGVQTTAGLLDCRVIPALDSLFLGSVLRAGSFEEKCSLCGVCTLDRFEGLCPVTLCPKGVLNGPCGGMVDGSCELDSERDCVWHRIFLLKEERGTVKDLEEIVAPRPHNRPTPSEP